MITIHRYRHKDDMSFGFIVHRYGITISLVFFYIGLDWVKW